MLRLVATSPPTSTCAVLPKSTPLGLTRNTWPLAVRRPRISEPPDELVTRFSTTEEELGCAKLTLAPDPILKLDQLMIACWVPWFTPMREPDWVIVALPAATCPPLGSAAGSSAYAGHAPNATSMLAANTLSRGSDRWSRARVTVGVSEVFYCLQPEPRAVLRAVGIVVVHVTPGVFADALGDTGAHREASRLVPVQAEPVARKAVAVADARVRAL